MRRDAVALRELAAGMTGQRSTGRPQTDSGTAATALLTGIEGVGGRNVLTWRGATGADGYLVQRATGGGGWLTITPTPLSANDAPWTDITAQVVVSPPAGAPGSVTWIRPALCSTTFDVAAAGTPDLTVLVSPDGGSTWRAEYPTVRRTGTDAYELSVSGLTGHLRVSNRD